MKKLLLLFIIVTSAINSFAQGPIQYPKSDTTSVDEVYPYILPIWGQKLTDRNIDFQLPFGINVNYVYNYMDLDLTHFEMTDSNGDPILPDLLNEDSLNFKETTALTNGINIRLDAWILPFLNVYGIYSETKGQTKIALAPYFLDELYIDVPAAEFDATTWGIGTTFVYGWSDYFVSLDANASSSKSQLLNKAVLFFVGSARLGRRIKFNNGMKLSVYVGAMYRNFINHEKSDGSIKFEEIAPGFQESLLDGIEQRYLKNEEIISKLPDGALKDKYIARNEELLDNYTRIDNGQINYSIKKEIKKLWSTQIGFNWEISQNWMYRGELGYAHGQKFFMTGLQYRFGL
jgi:hypothetical protein